MNMIHVRHAGTDAVAEVPESALPILRQSGWDVLPDEDTEARAQQVLDDAAAADRAMREAGLAAIPPEDRPTAVSEDAGMRQIAEDGESD